MFENIIEQSAASQLRGDIQQNRLAPSMLFFGPTESGKCSSALELARSLSCEEDASWKCRCSSCENFRYLQTSDLLLIGHRIFLSEISACASAFLRNTGVLSAKILFIRSVRKLQLRFSQVLTEDNSKLGTAYTLMQSLEEKLNELLLKEYTDDSYSSLEKLTASVLKDSSSLSSLVSINIPVEHIRRAANWCYLSPFGKRKTLIIENADNMRDDARNSLLKLLEEPPAKLNIILTSKRRESIIPTILSRLRPYRFLKRSTESEKDVLRRVFQVPQNELDKITPLKGSSLITAYLDSFNAQNSDKITALASFFAVNTALKIENTLKTAGKNIPSFITALIKRYANIAEYAGFEIKQKDNNFIKVLFDKSENFEDGSFPSFLAQCLEISSDTLKSALEPESIVCNDIFKKYINEADAASGTLNQNKLLVTEALLFNLHNKITERL